MSGMDKGTAIKYLTPKHKRAIRLAVSGRYMETRLKELGYHPVHNGHSNSAHTIYVNYLLGLVVKRPYTTLSGRNRVPKCAVPTVKLVDSYVVQPRVDTSRKAIDAAYRAISRSRNRIEDFGDDTRDVNIGLYNGKAVVFDW